MQFPLNELAHEGLVDQLAPLDPVLTGIHHAYTLPVFAAEPARRLVVTSWPVTRPAPRGGTQLDAAAAYHWVQEALVAQGRRRGSAVYAAEPERGDYVLYRTPDGGHLGFAPRA